MRTHNLSNVSVKATGPGFLSLLALLFIGLRLAGQIDWHWAWILGPLWMPIAAALGVCLVVLVSCIGFGACVGAVRGIRMRAALARARREGRA